MVKERPILFSGPMVRAILDGRKTQTRRIVQSSIADFHTMDFMHLENDGSPEIAWFESGRVQEWVKCPYGAVGDRLWVRETWQSAAAMNQCHHVDDYTIFKATDPDWEVMEGWKWRPSIFMPKFRSRITLEITGVRLERLHDITEADAIAEGFKASKQDSWRKPGAQVTQVTAVENFEQLWHKINGKDSWAVNPWVWVVEFKRIDA